MSVATYYSPCRNPLSSSAFSV